MMDENKFAKNIILPLGIVYWIFCGTFMHYAAKQEKNPSLTLKEYYSSFYQKPIKFISDQISPIEYRDWGTRIKDWRKQRKEYEEGLMKCHELYKK